MLLNSNINSISLLNNSTACVQSEQANLTAIAVKCGVPGRPSMELAAQLCSSSAHCI